MINKKNVAIIGTSPISIIYAIYLQKKFKYNVSLLERKNELGGAWGVDGNYPKYSNFLLADSKKQKNSLEKIYQKLKKYYVKIISGITYTYYNGKSYTSPSLSFFDLYKKQIDNIKIVKNFNVNKLIIENKHICVNSKKFFFDVVFIPSNVLSPCIVLNKKIFIKKRWNQDLVTSFHARFEYNNKSYKKNELSRNTFDRYSLTKYKKKNIFNGRISRSLKHYSENKIKKIISSIYKDLRIENLKIFKYQSTVRSEINTSKFINKVTKLKNIKYLNSSSLASFVLSIKDL